MNRIYAGALYVGVTTVFVFIGLRVVGKLGIKGDFREALTLASLSLGATLIAKGLIGEPELGEPVVDVNTVGPAKPKLERAKVRVIKQGIVSPELEGFMPASEKSPINS